MGIIESLSKEFWYDVKQSLQSYVQVCGGFEKAKIRRFCGHIEICGEVSVWFTEDCKLRIWNTVKENSGEDVYIDSLVKLQENIKEWYENNIGEIGKMCDND